MRRDFIGKTRNPEIRVGEDKAFFQELQQKHPTERFTGIVAKHYNFPRENSLIDNYIKETTNVLHKING